MWCVAAYAGERLQVKQWLLLRAGVQLRELQSDLVCVIVCVLKKEIWEVFMPQNNEHIFAL